jgi:hypothetical protein
MDTVGETSFETPGDMALEITRKFDSPRQTVFDAVTEPSTCERSADRLPQRFRTFQICSGG